MVGISRRAVLAAGVASAGAVAGCLDVLGPSDSWDGTIDGTEWPMRGRTPATTHVNPEASVPSDGIEQEWLVEGDRPRIADGELVIVEDEGDGRVVAYDRTTGEDERTVWNGPVDDVALAGGTAYVLTFDRRSATVREVDVATGREGWQVDLGPMELEIYSDPRGVARTFCVTRDRVYLLPQFAGHWDDIGQTDYGPLYVIDRATGTIVWEQSDAIDVAVEGERVVTLEITDGDPALAVRRPSDGEVIDGIDEGIPSVLWVADSCVATADGVAYVCGEHGRVVGGDLGEGRVLGDHSIGITPNGLAVGTDRVYVSAHDLVEAYERPLGERAWSFRVPEVPDTASFTRRSPIVTANAVLFTATAGRLFALDPATGDQLWVASASSQDVPKAVGDRVYLSTFDGVAVFR